MDMNNNHIKNGLVSAGLSRGEADLVFKVLCESKLLKRCLRAPYKLRRWKSLLNRWRRIVLPRPF